MTLVEHLGNETIVNLTLPSGQSLIAALDGDTTATVGTDLSLGFSPDKAALFSEQGIAIS